MVLPMTGYAPETSRPDFQRLVGDLIRPGLVASVDLAADPKTCTVEIGDIETGPLPFMTLRAGRVRIWSPPSKGEQCLVLCSEGDSNAGFVLPALFCDAFPAPSTSPDICMVAFDDSSTLTYDMAAHHLAFDLPSGSASINAPQGISLTGPVTIDGNVTLNGAMEASGDVTADGVSVKSHRHGNVQAGSAQSGTPVA